MSDKTEMSFLDHLEELRWHLIRSMVSVLLFSIVAFCSKSFVFNTLIMGPSRTDFLTYQWLCQLSEWMNSDALCISDLPFVIQNRTMTGQFAMHIMSSLIVGAIFAFPYTFWEIWRFVRPGLYRSEQQATTGATLVVSFLFAMGVLFSYYVVSPLAVNFLAHYQIDPSVKNEFDLTSYVSTLAMIVLSGGIMFQLPVVVYFLSKAGLATPEGMRIYRKHAIVLILIVAAIITPPDPMTQLLIGLPIMALYEVSIMICARVQKRMQRETELILGKSVED